MTLLWEVTIQFYSNKCLFFWVYWNLREILCWQIFVVSKNILENAKMFNFTIFVHFWGLGSNLVKYWNYQILHKCSTSCIIFTEKHLRWQYFTFNPKNVHEKCLKVEIFHHFYPFFGALILFWKIFPSTIFPRLSKYVVQALVIWFDFGNETRHICCKSTLLLLVLSI